MSLSPAIALHVLPADSSPVAGSSSPPYTAGLSSPDVEKSSKVADSYPFIRRVASSPSRDIGRAGDLAAEIEEADPLLLRERVFRDADFDSLKQRGRRMAPSRAGKQAKKLADFYDSQNARINALLKPISSHAQDASDEDKAHARPVKIAVRASLIANCLLLVVQLYAAISSLSLSFFASAIDGVFDPAVTIMLFIMGRKAANADPLVWPVGGSRLISVGNVVYASIMAAASLVLIVLSVQNIVTHKSTDDDRFHLPATLSVAIALGTKIVLFAYCYTCRTYGEQVEILYEDHRNDMFLNAFALFTNAAGAKIKWFIDPLGAIIISIGLIWLWGGSAITELRHLAGVTAPAQLIELVIYKCMTFSETIIQIDSCKAYHNGNRYTVEVDIVMPPETPLWKAHDISQLLQDQLETLPKVDRVFVHCDWEVSHKPEHRNSRLNDHLSSTAFMAYTIPNSELASRLQLVVHAEGGNFVESYRSPETISSFVSKTDDRSLYTVIYYNAVTAKPRGLFHKHEADSIHILHQGRAEFTVIDDTTTPAVVSTHILGSNLAAGEQLQVIVKANKWRAIQLLDEDREKGKQDPEHNGVLFSEICVPGFDFSNHSFLTKEKLYEIFADDQEQAAKYEYALA